MHVQTAMGHTPVDAALYVLKVITPEPTLLSPLHVICEQYVLKPNVLELHAPISNPCVP